jgi:hypothetical protein
MNRVMVALAALVLSAPRGAVAQSEEHQLQLGAHVASATSGEFDKTDIGAGVRFSWHPISLLGVETEISLYPGDFAGNPPFSSSRVEGLFGVTVGPRFSRLRPSARLRPGFVAFRGAPKPFACILIFPPPLPCALAAGERVFALDVGGGMEWFPTNRTFVRVDIGDRLIRYPAPVIDSEGMARRDSFLGHDFRLAAGSGLRF